MVSGIGLPAETSDPRLLALRDAVGADGISAAPDFAIRKGGGMTDERPVLSWPEFLELKSGPNRNRVRRYALAYYGPHAKTGERGWDRTPILMPAEKHQKWWGQGYLPIGYVQLPERPPRRWLPSMIEDAIDKGLPIPEELRPPGYYGPVIPRTATVAAVAAPELPGPAVEAWRDAAPVMFTCRIEGCVGANGRPRFFDTERARLLHEQNAHKARATVASTEPAVEQPE